MHLVTQVVPMQLDQIAIYAALRAGVQYIYAIGADQAGDQVVVGGITVGTALNCTRACDATAGCAFTVYAGYLSPGPNCFLKNNLGTFNSGSTRAGGSDTASVIVQYKVPIGSSYVTIPKTGFSSDFPLGQPFVTSNVSCPTACVTTNDCKFATLNTDTLSCQLYHGIPNFASGFPTFPFTTFWVSPRFPSGPSQDLPG